VIENVVDMQKWDRYKEFLRRLHGHGYHVREEIYNSARFGVAQARRRLYIMCDLKREPKLIRSSVRKVRPARLAISLNGQYPAASVRRRKLAKRTRLRIRRAKRQLGLKRSFLLVYYGNDKGGASTGGWQRLNVPLRTVTTVDRFALVRPNGRAGHSIRMLQVPELAKAMGFPARRLRLNHGNRRDKIHLLGNAVCPPVMRAIVRALTRG
jgi:DNA (cytosine-5)-methyltransferase 1